MTNEQREGGGMRRGQYTGVERERAMGGSGGRSLTVDDENAVLLVDRGRLVDGGGGGGGD